MQQYVIYSFASVLIISSFSLIGVFTLSLNEGKLKKILLYLVSFSAGALFGDAFLHLLPEAVENSGFTIQLSLYVLSGIIFFFIVEKFIHWRHCHHPTSVEHEHPLAFMNLFGDALHNLLDGLIIGASYIVSIPLGIATTLTVLFHEIPQEIGDFGVLLHGGFSKGKALIANFLISLTAVIGTAIAIIFSNIQNLTTFILPFAVGGFIYIAGSDLIPELHQEVNVKKSLLQLSYFLLGIIVMLLLLFIE
jgi:zinc and cadmium transporter